MPNSEAARLEGDFEMHIVSFDSIFRCAKADEQERVIRERSLNRQTAAKGNIARMFCTDEL